MTVSNIRDKMQFEESYQFTNADGSEVILRIYATKRAGTYGYQFACILWNGNTEPICSDRTGGCGYDKVDHCVANVLDKAKLPNSKAGWGPRDQLIAAFGLVNPAIVHAHG